MKLTMLLLPIALLCICATEASDKPNILFIMADDLGWNDVSWHDTEVYTPNLDELQKNNAAVFTNAYVNQQCTQTRSAFFTGKYPFRMGLQDDVFGPMEPAGVPTDIPFYSEYLKGKGYATYMIGKWHLGHCKAGFLPTGRGFDKFLGFYNGGETYYTHEAEGMSRGETVTGYDFWSQDVADRTYAGSYSSEIFSAKTTEWLAAHDKDTPFFFFLSYQAPHDPLEAPPDQYLTNCNQESGSDRQIFCGIMAALDYSVGEVVQYLKDTKLSDTQTLYDNTIIVFTTDNGANVKRGGNNYPFRGNKGTLWEGGTHAVHFVHSPTYITNPGTRTQLLHIVDWFATIKHLAGDTVTTYEDGINQWSMISTGTAETERTELVYNINSDGSAIRVGKYKYITGEPGTPSGWTGTDGESLNSQVARKSMRDSDGNLLTEFLFDLDEDPYETVNLIYEEDMQDTITAIKAQLATYVAADSIHEKPTINGHPDNYDGTWGHGWC